MSRGRVAPHEAPLLAWGDAIRAARSRRLRRVRLAAVSGLGTASLALTALIPPAPRLVWNVSASAPLGLYRVEPERAVRRGDMVVARVGEPWRGLAAERHYLPANVPLVKQVAAAAGDQVCALGHTIFIDGEPVAERRQADRHGRPLPRWSGCVRLRGQQIFLLTQHPDSFDGRYFGVTNAADIVGRAVLLWRQ